MITRRRFLPTFAALQAFDAAARHGSFTRAADELCLTQGAISRQIRGLEQALGLRLFELVRQRVVLTEVGQRYHLDVRRTLDSLENTTLRAMSAAKGGECIEVATLPTFCSRWLIPQLPTFLSRHPHLTINFTSRFFPFDFGDEPYDAAIHYGAPAWPGALLNHLFNERMSPVCTPAFATENGIADAEDLRAAPLLQQGTRLSAWTDWFEAAGLSTDNATRGPRLDQISMVTQAALAGLGVALLPEFLIQDELARGLLVKPTRCVLETRNSYYLVVPEEKSWTKSIVQFRNWILEQAAQFRAGQNQETRCSKPEPSPRSKCAPLIQ